MKWLADALIRRAQRTPYLHLGEYMSRWWLVPYRSEPVSPWRRPVAWLLQRFDIAIRVHHIRREDLGEHMHDHPWNARTFVLRGWYVELRDDGRHMRCAGQTARIRFGEFHHILRVSPGGVWTVFVTGRKRGKWGFRVDGRKVPHDEYARALDR